MKGPHCVLPISYGCDAVDVVRSLRAKLTHSFALLRTYQHKVNPSVPRNRILINGPAAAACLEYIVNEIAQQAVTVRM